MTLALIFIGYILTIGGLNGVIKAIDRLTAATRESFRIPKEFDKGGK